MNTRTLLHLKAAALSCLVTLAASCTVDNPNDDADYVSVNCSVEVSVPEVKGDAVTSSPYKINDVTLASYGENGRMEDCRYFSSVSSMKLTLRKEGRHTIAALANAGDMRDKMPVTLRELKEQKTDISWDMINKGGFPMSGTAEYSGAGDRAVVKVERMLAKISLKIDRKWPENTSFTLKSVRIRNTNASVRPFGKSAADSRSDLMEGDYSTELKEEMVFYLPENMQGVLLPSNSDPYEKNREKILSSGKADLCSYMEITLHQEDTYGVSGDRMYRFYIGKDNTGDFNVARNADYRISFGITSEGMDMKGNWKVDCSGITDSRRLNFSQRTYLVPPGGKGYVNVRYEKSGTEDSSYTCFKSKDGWSFYDIPSALAIGDFQTGKGIAVTPVSGKTSPGASIPIRIRTFDGKLKDEARILIVQDNTSLHWKDGFMPSYIAQKGTLNAEVPEGFSSVSFSASEGSGDIIEIKGGNDGRSCTVSCIGEGEAEISVNGHIGSESILLCRQTVKVSAPSLSANPSSVKLPADGSGTGLNVTYKNREGKVMKAGKVQGTDFFDEDLYDRLLKPDFSFSDNDAGMFLAYGEGEIFVRRMSSGGTDILDRCGPSNAGEVYVKAPCDDVSPVKVTCEIDDPFPGASRQRILANVNNKYDGALGRVSAASTDIAREGVYSNTSTILTTLGDDAVMLSHAIPDMETGLSSGKLRIARKSNGGDYSAGKYTLYASVKHRRTGERSSNKILGIIESYLMTGFVAHAVKEMDNYNVSANFANRFSIKEFTDMEKLLEDVRMFGFAPGSTVMKSSQYYVFDYAEDYNEVYISPDSNDFMTWGSWCDVDAYSSAYLVGFGERIYSHHIGLTDSRQWEAEGKDFFSSCTPQITVDISKIGSSRSGLGSRLSGNYRLFWLNSDSDKGATGLPYHIIALPTSNKTRLPIPWKK